MSKESYLVMLLHSCIIRSTGGRLDLLKSIHGLYYLPDTHESKGGETSYTREALVSNFVAEERFTLLHRSSILYTPQTYVSQTI